MANVPHIKDIATVMTTDAYCRKPDGLSKDKYIFIPKKFEYGKTFFFEQKSDIAENGFVILAKPGFDIHYISFLLNSLVVALDFCNGNLSRCVSLSKKKLEQIPIRLCDNTRMFYLGLCGTMIQIIKRRLVKEPDNQMIQYHCYLFSEVRDGMSLELLTQPLFEKLGIHVIDEWEKIIYTSNTKPDIVNISDKLMQDNNELMNQIRKMRNVITNIGKLLSENKENDVEDK